MRVNISCGLPGEREDPEQFDVDLPQGRGLAAWTYDVRTFTYNFNINTRRSWAGMCAVVRMNFKQDRGTSLSGNNGGYGRGDIQAFVRFT
jgi:hypothetical protein